jgi:hypothetical protein
MEAKRQALGAVMVYGAGSAPWSLSMDMARWGQAMEGLERWGVRLRWWMRWYSCWV